MLFIDLLQEYEEKINYVNRMLSLEQTKHSKDYWLGYKRGVFHFFQQQKDFCEDFHPCINVKVNKTDPDQVGTLSYRDEEVPVFSDDAGQQLYIDYYGIIIEGGNFNPFPEKDFCYMIDKIKDDIKD